MALPEAKRWEIAFLCNHPLGPKLSYYAAGKYIGCSTQIAKKWATAEGGVYSGRKIGAGRKKGTTEREDKKLVGSSDKHPDWSRTKIQQHTQVVVSERTVRRRLNEAGKYSGPALAKPLLKPAHIEARLQFAQDNKNRDWDQVVFSDEATFWLNDHKRPVWQRKGARVVVRKVKHPAKVNVWGCFSASAFGRLHIFKENP